MHGFPPLTLFRDLGCCRPVQCYDLPRLTAAHTKPLDSHPQPGIATSRRCTLDPYKAILYTRTVVVLGFAAGFSLSPRLWISHRLYPLIPIFPGLPHITSPVDYVLFGLLLLLLIPIGMASRPRIYILAFAVLLLFLALLDQTRWQPWAYLYLFMLLALARFSWESDDIQGALNSLNICRLIVVATYFYSGLQKINPRFAAGVFSLLGPNASHHPALTLLGYMAAALEVVIVIGLLTRRLRDLAVIAGAFMHLFILFCCIFVYKWNSVVWPWNVAMIVLLFVLFWRTGFTYREVLWTNPLILQRAVLVLFGILPALSFFGWWDSYLSASLYSANVPVGNIFVGETVKSELPKPVQRYVQNLTGIGSVLRIQDWALGELNVPPYPAVRAYRRIGAEVCTYSNNSPDVTLIVHQKDTLLGKGGLVQDTCFGTLVVNKW